MAACAKSCSSNLCLLWILIPQALLPLVALLYASGIIQDEQEEQTITYLLVRPIPKWLMYCVKMAATWTTTVILVIALTVLTFAAIYVGSGADLAEASLRCLKAAAILSLAAIAYCSIFGVISLLTKRTLIVGILYTAVVEGLLANLPLSLRWGTVIYYTRMMAYRTMDFVVTWPTRAAGRCRCIGLVAQHGNRSNAGRAPNTQDMRAGPLVHEPDLYRNRRLALFAPRISRQDAGKGVTCSIEFLGHSATFWRSSDECFARPADEVPRFLSQQFVLQLAHPAWRLDVF